MINEVIKNFEKSTQDMMDISKYSEIPTELRGEDVYNYTYLFKNEDIAIKFIIDNLDGDTSMVTFDEFKKELHFYDDGISLSSLEIPLYRDSVKGNYFCKYGNCLHELNNGTYILCTLY
ncbi:MAG: hypothetical protein K6G00_00560 [Treponema sp.]|nr:hypothetical protein [Treponema sp.]